MESLPALPTEPSSPLPFRGGDGGGACQTDPELGETNSPHPNPRSEARDSERPEGEGLCHLAPTRHRDDGWTAERQRAFLERLAECGSVSEAAALVGMSRASAYALRRRADSRGFVQAWDAARALATEHLTEVAWDRALNGQLRPVYYHGEQVGEIRHYDNRLLLALIAQNRAAAGAALPSAEVVETVAQDWGAALDRVERGEALPETAPTAAEAAPASDLPPPLAPRRDRYGATLNEVQQLDIGGFDHWWDDELNMWLTNWPPPEKFDGRSFWIDAEDRVLGPYDPERNEDTDAAGRPITRSYARTLSGDELAGLDNMFFEEEAHRAARIELYRRASFGLASAAERASLAAAA